MNSTIRNFKNNLLKNKSSMQQSTLKQTIPTNNKMNIKLTKILKENKGPRGPTFSKLQNI